MRLLALTLLLAATPALAQTPAPKSQSCVNRQSVRTITPVSPGLLRFEMNGRTDYLNKAGLGCDYNPDFDTLIDKPVGGGASEICAGDVFDIVDREVHAYHGSCSLGDFTPIAKPPRPAAHNR